jgi:hypothetical protein
MPDINKIHAAYARTALENVRSEYPNYVMHLVHDSKEASNCSPSAHHPIFFGSYDWHSCVHMHWSMARLLNLAPKVAHSKAIALWFDRQFEAVKATKEVAYFERSGAALWERPYGWGWVLKLYAELAVCVHPHAEAWRAGLRPLVDYLADAMFHHLESANAPVRHSVHSNTAFSMINALRYATTVGDNEFIDLIKRKAVQWFGTDNDYRLAFDFSGEDFLSPALVEAQLMALVLPLEEFRTWFVAFLPELAALDLRHLTPTVVANEHDARQVHNHGLNLSRAWCMRGIMQMLDQGLGTLWQRFGELSGEHLRAAQAAITEGEYVSTHWLVSFALLAETEWQG